MITQDITYDAAVNLLTAPIFDRMLEKRIKSGKPCDFKTARLMHLAVDIHVIERTNGERL
jgi:hypothetical protein